MLKSAICPHCDSVQTVYIRSRSEIHEDETVRYYQVECENCHAVGPEAKTMIEALDAWHKIVDEKHNE